MMDGYSGDKQYTYGNDTTNTNSTSIYHNNTQPDEPTQEASTGSDSTEDSSPNHWPDWAKSVQCISHFLLTLYSSVTFLIYYFKQKTSESSGWYRLGSCLSILICYQLRQRDQILPLNCMV